MYPLGPHLLPLDNCDKCARLLPRSRVFISRPSASLCQDLRLLGAADCLEVRLAGGGGSDVVTLSPVAEAGGVLFAPIGLTNMLNAGGAVLRSGFGRCADRCGPQAVRTQCLLGQRMVAPFSPLSCPAPLALAFCAINLSESFQTPAPTRPHPDTSVHPLTRSCSISGGHSDDGYDVQPARAALTLRGAGTMLCYCSHAPTGVAVGGQQVPFSYDAEGAALTFELVPAEGRPAGAAVDCAVQF